MMIAVGERLGRYEILGDLGAGGMGEVYRARDTTLDRDVAIKVLPEGMAQDADRSSRFEREARAVARLAHPNILEIWDYGTDGGVSYAVAELLEGETVRDRLSRGPLEWSRAAELGAAIAGGLAAAHRAGIVHRDLKPSNVFITADGRVKILDFGLASVRSDIASEPDASAPGSTLTEHVAMVGTVGYMAPEQVRGEPADHRSDIFALGCVLYEAVTGRRAFEDETAADTMAAILKEEPAEMSSTGEVPPPELERTIRRCLAKRPDDRYQSAADLSRALREVSSVSETRRIPVRAGGKRVALGLGVGAVAVVAVALALSGLFSTRTMDPLPVRRYSIMLPSDAPLQPSELWLPQPPLALSRDGEWLVYVARTGNSKRLMRRKLDALEVEWIEWADVDVSTPFFSPDGRFVGFGRTWSGPEIILLSGDMVPFKPRDRNDSRGFTGGAWQDDGFIVFTTLCPPGIHRISSKGGDAEPLMAAHHDARESAMWFPEPLPGGEALLLSMTWKSDYRARWLGVYSFASGELKPVIRDAMYGRYAPTGHLVFAMDGGLYAKPFDAGTLSSTGGYVEVSEPGMVVEGRNPYEWAFAQDGTLVYAPVRPEQLTEKILMLVDRSGNEERLDLRLGRHISAPRLSPDGRRVAIGVVDERAYNGHSHIWIHNLDTGGTWRFTTDFAGAGDPIWTPDGENIVFRSARDGCGDLYMKPVDAGGTEEAERLTESEYPPFPYSFSSDGATLFFWDWGPSELSGDLFAVHIAGEQPEVERVFRSQEPLWQPAVSPDGRWLAHVASAMVKITPYPEMDRFVPASNWGGGHPMWHPDGGSLFFLDGRGRLMEVEVRTDPKFSVGSPELVAAGPFESYDVAAGGDRFLVVKIERGEPITELVVVENWFEELKRKVPPA
jgi:Tol biopolymer transport system component